MAARRRVTALAVVAVLTGGLAACGTSARQAGPSPASSASSASPSVGAKPTDRSPRGVMLSAELALQSARRVKFTYQMSPADGGPSDSGDGVLFWAPRTILQLKRTTPGATDQLIVLDTVSYQGGDAATALRLGGRHWEKSGAAVGADGQKQTPFGGLIDQLNPLLAVTAAVGAPDLQLLGEEKLGDSTAEHYTATVTVADYAAAEQNLLTSDGRQQLAAALSQGAVTTLTLDLWLNDKDQLVQLHRSGRGSKGSLDHTVQYSDFGGPFSVQAPPDGDTRDAGR